MKTQRKRATSFKLSDTAHAILEELSERRGNSKTAILERLLRDEASRSGIDYRFCSACGFPESDMVHRDDRRGNHRFEAHD